MNFSNYRVSLDMHDTSSQAMLNVKQGDSARKIYFSLTDGGRPYKISADCTARLRAKTSNGTILFNDCAINDNVIEYTLTNETCKNVGIVECEVTLYGADSNKITSPRFSLIVEGVITSDNEIESTNEFTALDKALNEANNLDISVDKVNDTTTISITKKDGTTEKVDIANGAVGGKTFWSYEQLVTELNSVDNTAYYQGQHMLIKTLNVPDVWIYDVAETSEPYTYIDDASFAEAVTGSVVQVGYYVLSALETQKVNLDEYVKKTDYGTKEKFGVVSQYDGAQGGINIINGKVCLTGTLGGGLADVFFDNPEKYGVALLSKDLYKWMKAGLSHNTETLTDEEKASALAWLGANDAFSNALKSNASGEIIRIDDISPIEHTVKAKVRSKNLLNADGMVNASFVKNDDGSFTFTKSSSSRFSNWVDTSFPANTTFSFSATNIEGTAGSFAFQVKCKDGNYLSFGPFSPAKLSYSGAYLSSEVVAVRMFFGESEAEGAYFNINGLQVELGGVTEYVPFVDLSANSVFITRRGKNLIAYPYNFNKDIQVVDGVKTQTINGITVVESEDRSLIFNGTATDKATFYLYGWYGGETEPLIPLTNTFSISGNQKTDRCKVEVNTCTFNEASGEYDAMCWHACRDNELTLSFDKKHLLKSAYISIEAGTTVNNYTVRPQIEIGGVSKYEPYIEPVTYPVNADGTVDGVKSVYPTTVLMADTDGANITSGYNKDINAVLGSVETALDNIIAIQESLIGGDSV